MTVGGAEADLAVVTCADHEMLPAACCALLSTKGNISEPTRLILVALDLSTGDAAAIESFNRRHGLDIEVIAFRGTLLPAVEKGRWPKSVLTRLFLDDLVPTAIRRLLYLDADTLTVDSLDALMDADLSGNCVAAVDDYIMAFPKKLAARRRALSLSADSPYFNSGVILFDWQNPCARDILRTARERLAHFNEDYHATDQDALNSSLDGRWKRLDPRWNAQTGFVSDIFDPAIVHFTGRRKPWQSGASWKHRIYSPLYRSWLKGTPWETNYPTPRRANSLASLALHLTKRVEGLRKDRRVTAYLKNRRAQILGRIQR